MAIVRRLSFWDVANVLEAFMGVSSTDLLRAGAEGTIKFERLNFSGEYEPVPEAACKAEVGLGDPIAFYSAGTPVDAYRVTEAELMRHLRPGVTIEAVNAVLRREAVSKEYQNAYNRFNDSQKVNLDRLSSAARSIQNAINATRTPENINGGLNGASTGFSESGVAGREGIKPPSVEDFPWISAESEALKAKLDTVTTTPNAKCETEPKTVIAQAAKNAPRSSRGMADKKRRTLLASVLSGLVRQ